MVRLFYVIGICAWLAAGIVSMHIAAHWRYGDLELDELRGLPGVMEVFQRQEDQKAQATETMTSPLLTQAEALANYLNPPAPVVAESVVPAESKAGGINLPSVVEESVAPKAVSAAFRVVAMRPSGAASDAGPCGSELYGSPRSLGTQPLPSVKPSDHAMQTRLRLRFGGGHALEPEQTPFPKTSTKVLDLCGLLGHTTCLPVTGD